MNHLPEQVSFGQFRLDLRTRELFKNGDTFNLQEQPFLVLKALLEQPGQLVTREELIQRLWSADTFVDFEHSLNKAVKRLREALHDSAEEPRFIETLPRRGYRFIGTLATIPNVTPDSPATDPKTEGAKQPPIVSSPQSLRGHTAALMSALALVLVVSAAGLWLAVRREQNSHAITKDAPIRSLAVLPLENLSGDASQDYFADGMTDQLITDLGQIGELRVISRTSAMQYKGAHKSLPQIARELNVDAVVEGTVVRSGDRVRITAQLIQARTDRHLWAQDYHGDVRDVLGLQNQVARAIAEQVLIKLTAAQKANLENSQAVNPKAHELYLKAHFYHEKDVDQGFQKAIELFDEAIGQQPDLALAYAGKANAYVRLGHTLALPPEQAFPSAKAAALKALTIDANNSEAHVALGQAEFLYDWNFAAAEGEFQRAILLNPNSSSAETAYSSFLNAMGRPDESIGRARRALDVDPVSLFAMDNLGAQLYWARRYDEAVEEGRKGLEMDSSRVQNRFFLGAALEQKREFPEAIMQLEKAVELSHDKWGMAFVAHARALSGDKPGARKILAELERLSNDTYVSPWWRAIVYPDLGDKEKAFYWLEKAYQGREHDLVFSKVWPMFDSLRSDPRYQDLMRRVGLPE
jgi:TolB-like protein/DNA-binding winged helix-turn-helix (wHTH) protein/Flp pilus assembly protein TadD